MTTRGSIPQGSPKPKRIITLMVGLAIACSTTDDLPAAQRAKRARPPRFTQDVTDAFFPDARAKLVGPRPERPRRGDASKATGPANDDTLEFARSSWPQLITVEALENEIKNAQIKLGQAVSNVTKFKAGDHQLAREQFNLLAALFGIAAQYGQPMRWQREAPAARERMARAGAACKVGTDSTYKEAKNSAEHLETLIRGGSTEPARDGSRAKLAVVPDRASLMKRLEKAHDQGLAAFVANPSDFARNVERAMHEGQVIAAVARVIVQEEYEFSDDEAYRQFADAMRIAAGSVREAASRGNYTEAREATAKLGKTCANCHEGYRN